MLLTAAGIGVVAVATDLLAVRLHRPAVAGLPLLVLFCIPLTTSAHQGVFGAMTVFGVGMAGYLAMLAVAREKLSAAVPLHLADMSSFELGTRFDAIACAYQGVNHLLSFPAWNGFFACAVTSSHSQFRCSSPSLGNFSFHNVA